MDFITIALLLLIAFFIVMAIILLTIRNPLWGIMFVMVTHFWFGSIEAQIYPRILSIVFIMLIMLSLLATQKVKWRRLSIDSKTKTLLSISIVLFLWEIFVNQIIHSQSIDYFISVTAKVFVPILLSILIYFAIKKESQLKYYILVLILLVTVSSAIGILQYIGISWAWILREIQSEVIQKPEPAGLALFSLLLSYQVSYLSPIVFSLILGSRSGMKIVLLIILLVLTISLLATGVRSAILGTLSGILCIFVLFKNYKRGAAALTSFYLLLFTIFTIAPSIFKEVSNISDESAYSRIPLFLTALRIAEDNPVFGIGSGRFQEFSIDYYYYVSHMRGAETVLITAPHNQFLNMLDYFGVPALVLLILFYMILLRKLIVISKESVQHSYYFVSLGLIGAHISYVINSFFHNTGPFLSDPYAWFFIGITFVIFKFHSQKAHE